MVDTVIEFSAPLCACGCGKRTRWEKNKRAFNTFITGHNARSGRRKVWLVKTCGACGKDFDVYPHQGDRKFCSSACRDDGLRLRVGTLNNKFSQISHRCPTCYTDFLVIPCRLERARERGSDVYCSMPCAIEGRRRKIAGKPRRGAKESAGKLAAKKRDGYACVMCGFNAMVHVHHVVPKSKGGGDRLDNLITLCPNHHALAHLGTLTVKTMLSAIAKPPALLVFAEAQSPRPSGRIAKRFYRVDLA